MSTTLFYYTGTGNSLWVARTLAEKLDDATLVSISSKNNIPESLSTEKVGFIFPIYIWGIPAPVVNFVKKIAALKPKYCFGLAVNGGQVANSLVQLKKLLAKEGVTLSAGYEITTPSNYIPWGSPPAEEKQKELFSQAQIKLSIVAEDVEAERVKPVEKGALWQRLIFSTLLYPMSYPQVPKMDGSFWVDEKCNECGICQKVCPAGNVELPEGKPTWKHRCEQCFACLQWCPKEAIQYGKKTPQYKRYQHPEVAVNDIIKSRE